jgi:hypothetical protein
VFLKHFGVPDETVLAALLDRHTSLTRGLATQLQECCNGLTQLWATCLAQFFTLKSVADRTTHEYCQHLYELKSNITLSSKLASTGFPGSLLVPPVMFNKGKTGSA